MMFLDKTIQMCRGESATVRAKIFTDIDEEKVPYTMPKDIKNPYLLIQIRNTQFDQNGKASVYNYFLPADDFILRTKSRTPMYVESKDDVTDENILYYTLENGERRYYYYNGTNVKEYTCEFEKMFLPIYTGRWRQQTWWYTICLVSGVSMIEYLQSTFDSYCGIKEGIRYEEYNSKQWLYDEICKVKPSFEGSVSPDDILAIPVVVDSIIKSQKFIIM